MSTEAAIKHFILENLVPGRASIDIDPDDSLVNSGMVNSLGMLRLITFIEQQYEMEVGDADVGFENFGTLRRLAAFVDRRLEES